MNKTFIDPNNESGSNNKNGIDNTRFENQPVINQNEQEGESDNPNRIVLNNVRKSQKEKILALAGSGLIGAVGGAGAFAFLSFVEDAANPTPPEPETAADASDPIDPEPVIIYTDAPFAHDISEDMSFGEAFNAARAEVGPGGFFEWHGNTYNTYYKEEWELLSPSERDEFMSSVDHFDHSPENQQAAAQQNLENDIIQTEIDGNSTNGDSSYIITEEDFIETADLDGDGIIDAAMIDANGNPLPDVVIDLNVDGEMDVLILDVNPETGVTGHEEIVILDDTQNQNEAIATSYEADVYNDSDINPDIDIDNNMNMTDYV